jgi:1,2-diacylglycerol 3-beta-glucosyltransferase
MFLSALDLFLVSLGLIYFIIMMSAGLQVIRAARAGSHRRPTAGHGQERGSRLGLLSRWSALDRGWAAISQPTARLYRRVHIGVTTPEGPVTRAPVVVDAADWVVYFLVPCLNEAAVIEDTVRELLSDRRARVVVVDDASADGTGELAVSVDPARVRLVRRELPAARLGKGPALNEGYAAILRDAAEAGLDPWGVIVCVMDADGRASARALDAVLPLFADDRVGGLQLPVKIRNKDKLLTRMQDVEFWGSAAVAQLGRTRFGTVSLGGNGQFTRLAALMALDRDPWMPSLTEDLDLALALLAAGWLITSTADAFVTQEAIPTFKALIRQRTRWLQGHMLCYRRIPELWKSRSLSHVGLLEITMYLMTPWILVLPWSIVLNYSLLVVAESFVFGSNGAFGSSVAQHVVTLSLWYLLSFMPCWLSGYLYYRQDRRAGLARSLALGHLLLAANYVTYIACWRAFYRILVGRAGWDKTARRTGAALPARSSRLPMLAHLVPAPRSAPRAGIRADRSGVALAAAGAVPTGDGPYVGVTVPARAGSGRPVSHRRGDDHPARSQSRGMATAGGHRAPARHR